MRYCARKCSFRAANSSTAFVVIENGGGACSTETNSIPNLEPAERYRQAIELERDEAAKKGAELISNWFLETQLHRPFCGMIVDKVRLQLARDEATGVLPTAGPLNVTVDEMTRRTKPPELNDNSCDIFAWDAEWLLRWIFPVLTDETIRWKVLDLAVRR